MQRPKKSEYDPYFDHYVQLTRGANALQNLNDSGEMLIRFLENLPEDKRDYAYEEGKWTVQQLVQHLIDCDLVFTYRALWMARGGEPNLAGFDENIWANNAKKASLNWNETLQQFKTLRNFTVGVFKSLPNELMDQTATVSGSQTTLRSLPFIIAGHSFHHLTILKERYL